MRESAGLNDPWTTQYVRWIVNVFHGDFGESFIFKLPVSTLIGSRAVNTILLSLVTVVIMYAIALPLGVLSGRYQNLFWINLSWSITFSVLQYHRLFLHSLCYSFLVTV